MAVIPNHLVELLPRKDRYRLLALCEPVQLELEEALCEPGEPMRHVYFPTDGSISLVALIDGRPHVAIGMVGREGMVGAEFTLGVGSAQLRALVRHQGTVWRIGQRAFRKELASSEALQRSANRYLYLQMALDRGDRMRSLSPDRSAPCPLVVAEPGP